MVKLSAIREKAEIQWANLPSRFRLSSTLKECSGDAFKRDMLASMRLDQLHVLFLLQLSFIDSLAEPDPSMIDVSDQMLGLVIESILLRDRLVFSGTSLVWKVSSRFSPDMAHTLLNNLIDCTLRSTSCGDYSFVDAKAKAYIE